MQPNRPRNEGSRSGGWRRRGDLRSGLVGTLEDALRRVLPVRLKPFARWIVLAGLVVVAAVGGRQVGPHLGGGDGTRVAGPVEGVARLVDGDSFFIGEREVRLTGIDAPEGRQTCTRDGKSWPCGEEARRQLARLIGGHTVACRAVETDQHGRILGHCRAGEAELNREMVRSGYALAYGAFDSDERDARAGRRGLWSGEFERPRDWRRSHGIGR